MTSYKQDQTHFYLRHQQALETMFLTKQKSNKNWFQFRLQVLLLVVQRETPAHGDKTDPNFQYGTTQAYVALVILVIIYCNHSCFLIKLD